MLVPRTCSELTEENDTQPSEKPLADYEGTAAYVLLGAPGAGKTVAFREESQREGACYVTARDFLTFDDKPEWHEGTLFIDALDEMRAGSDDQRTPLDHIRAKLYALGRPRFRLSCREADWLGASDQTHLAAVSKDGKIRVLRLNPLSRDQARQLLAGRRDVDGTDAFIEHAEAQGISSLLGNPQDLEMLASAVSSGKWPKTRRETFDLAYRQLLREGNEEHVIGDATNASDDELLDAAGRLCAVLLLGDHQGVDRRATAERDHVALREVTGMSQGVLKAALRTRLFVYPSSRVATPAHRQTAEYLSGRYLASLIRDGLPVGRIIALLTGADGGVVSGLRGLCAWLAAWLAAHSQTGRLELLERDPIGAVLYGDVRQFATEEKRQLLQALEQHAARDPRNLLARHDLDARWADLATCDVEPIFRQALTDTGGDAKQVVAQAVLAALERGNSIPRLRPLLMDVVRNNDCWPVVRSAALRAYLKERGDDVSVGELRQLLDDINAGTIRDPVDGLRGALLMHLYPRWMTPAETCRYLRPPDMPTVYGLSEYFWLHTVANESTREQLGEVLDTLAKNADVVPREGPLRMVPHRLLSRLVGDSVDIDAKRLFDWLGLVSKPHDQQLRNSLSRWLAERPQHYKELVDTAVAAQSDMHAMMQSARRIPRCRIPSDFGSWCLSRATAVASEEAARYYLLRLLECLDGGEGVEGFSWEAVPTQLETRPTRLKWWRLLLGNRGEAQAFWAQAMAEDEADAQRTAAKEDEERWDEQERWRERLRRHEVEIRENKCPAALLDYLAQTYFGLFEQAETPAARLLALLGEDGLVQLALTAIRNTPSRTDLPEAAEIVRLALEERYHYLAWPFLAALEERRPLELGTPPLDDDGIRLAMTFHLNTQRHARPCWYQSVLHRRPDLVADVLIDSCKLAFSQGKTDLAAAIDFKDELGRAVAKRAVMPLLRMFPPRCKRDQLPALRYLLAAVTDSRAGDDLAQLVQRKLSLRTMTVVQRLHWLCFGLMLEPQAYLPQARRLLCGKNRNRHLDVVVALFKDGVLGERGLLQEQRLDVCTLSFLIKAIGLYCGTLWSANGDRIVRRLVASLASRTSPEATTALAQLVSDEELDRWVVDLQHAASLQADARREAEFNYASVDAVQATLDGLRPANAADLAALTADCLEQMAKCIRSGDTSDWRQYWSTSKADSWEPKDENLCRDALLSDLQIRLEQVDVQAVPEGVYANDGRADIRVSGQGFNVPVEIKKSNSRDLWQAIQGQLVEKYADDPGAQGHGIYLVFWFGREHCQRHPSHGRPREAADLAEGLQGTLTPDQAKKIAVVVVDVSSPDRATKAAATAPASTLADPQRQELASTQAAAQLRPAHRRRGGSPARQPTRR